MKLKTLLPALVLGLSLSSVAMARKSDGGSKHSRKTKIEKQAREVKPKMKKSEMR